MAPRLPDDSILGGLPEGNSRRPIASFDTTAPAEAMQALGRGIQNLGSGIGAGLTAVAARQTEQDNLDEVTARSERQVNNLNLLDSANKSNDPNEIRGFFAQLEKNDQSFLSRIKDPQRRQQAAAEIAVDTTRQRIKLDERAKYLDDKNFTDGMNNQFEDVRRKALENPNDPEIQKQAKALVDTKLVEAVSRKIITREEADAKRRKWNDEYAWDSVKLLPPQDAAVALTRPTEVSASVKERQKIAFQYFRSRGWSPMYAAVIAGGLTHESRLNPGIENKGDQKDGSSSMALAQWDPNRFARLKQFASMNRTSWNDFGIQLAFVQWELENTHTGAAAALREATNLRDATSAFTEKYFRPAGTGKGGYENLRGWADRYAQANSIATQFGGLPPDPNVARLQGLGQQISPEKRQQMWDYQEREYNQQRKIEIEQAAADRSSRINQLELNIIDGKAGRIEIDAARESGDVVDADKVSKLYRMVEDREKKDASARLFGEIIASGGKIDPLNPDHKKAAEEGVEVLSKRGNLKPPEVASAIFEATGYRYMPKAGSRLIRNGLNSQDFNDVRDAAQVASNALSNNPRAFDETEGGSDIEKAGVKFRHLVFDLGLDPDAAAKRMLLESSEEYKRKNRVNETEVKKFSDDLKKNAVADLQKAAFPGSHFFFNNTVGAPNARDAIAEDYAELATMHYQENGNIKEAKAYAVAQLNKLYGVSNGVLMKYPPERVYPPVDGKHDYIYRQAAEAVKEVRGIDLKPSDIALVPVDKARTGSAWKAMRETPYDIAYKDPKTGMTELLFRSEGGRRGFVASPDTEQTRVRLEREKGFNDARAALIPPGNTLPPKAAADVAPRVGRATRTEAGVQAEVDRLNAAQQQFKTEMDAANAARQQFIKSQEQPKRNVPPRYRNLTPGGKQ